MDILSKKLDIKKVSSIKSSKKVKSSEKFSYKKRDVECAESVYKLPLLIECFSKILQTSEECFL
jgi:hypothetical protein